MEPAREALVREAITGWEEVAAHARQDGHPGAAAIYARAAEALRHEQATGVAHCSCCLKPLR